MVITSSVGSGCEPGFGLCHDVLPLDVLQIGVSRAWRILWQINETLVPSFCQFGIFIPFSLLRLLRSAVLRRRSAIATGSAMVSAIEAERERKPAKSASATSNQCVAQAASGEKAESVIATTGTPRCGEFLRLGQAVGGVGRKARGDRRVLRRRELHHLRHRRRSARRRSDGGCSAWKRRRSYAPSADRSGAWR